MDISTFRDQELQNVNERLHNDWVKEFFAQTDFLFLTEARIVIIEICLVSKFIKYFRICQIVHSWIVSMNKGLLINFVLDCS